MPFYQVVLQNNQGLRDTFALAVHNSFAPLADLPDDVKQASNLFRDNIVDTAVKMVGEKKRYRKGFWLSEDAYRLIEMKREAVVRGDKPERNMLKRSFKAKALADRDTYYNGIADEAKLALQRHDMKPIYRAVKHTSWKSTSTQSVFPKNASGESCSSEEEALLR